MQEKELFEDGVGWSLLTTVGYLCDRTISWPVLFTDELDVSDSGRAETIGCLRKWEGDASMIL